MKTPDGSGYLDLAAYPCMVLAALGFVLAAYAHVAAVLGMTTFMGNWIWALHIGIFVVWFPAVLVGQSVSRNVPRNDFWKVALLGCPDWMKTAMKGVIGYALANFLYFVVFQSPGRHAATADPATVRGFSGHWLVFYGAAFCVMYSVRRRPDLLKETRCPQGHPANPLLDYCGACGERVTKPGAGLTKEF